jgi:hypothetical protein
MTRRLIKGCSTSVFGAPPFPVRLGTVGLLVIHPVRNPPRTARDRVAGVRPDRLFVEYDVVELRVRQICTPQICFSCIDLPQVGARKITTGQIGLVGRPSRGNTWTEGKLMTIDTIPSPLRLARGSHEREAIEQAGLVHLGERVAWIQGD